MGLICFLIKFFRECRCMPIIEIPMCTEVFEAEESDYSEEDWLMKEAKARKKSECKYIVKPISPIGLLELLVKNLFCKIQFSPFILPIGLLYLDGLRLPLIVRSFHSICKASRRLSKPVIIQ